MKGLQNQTSKNQSLLIKKKSPDLDKLNSSTNYSGSRNIVSLNKTIDILRAQNARLINENIKLRRKVTLYKSKYESSFGKLHDSAKGESY